MLNLLMEGRALTAKELAFGAGVEPATGTAHLQRLLVDSLVTARIQGRHKYFRLASPDVARCVESMMALAAPASQATAERSPIHEARFCYDHLAGRFAIALTMALTRKGWVQTSGQEFVLSSKGSRWCRKFGIDIDALSAGRRKFAPQCLDWSERKEHIGGALGAALADKFIENGWVKRDRDSRLVRVTRSGLNGLGSEIGLRWR
jgi:DNA-binding transcriptional ArsR family regulator